MNLRNLWPFNKKLTSPHQGLVSCLCTEKTLMSPTFQDWAERLKERRGHRHRKVWEWCFICEALYERGMLAPGKTGLGFAVGQEPLSALFATYGSRILATDLYTQEAQENGWVETGQHAGGYDAINKRGLCDDTLLRERVDFKFADMNHITPDLHQDFDFVWSSCALEHLGDLEKGLAFIRNSLACLKPGGVAVHTTEFNVSSNTATVTSGDTVLYRKRDIQDLVNSLKREGHVVEVDWNMGKGVADGFIDVPPYKQETHLKLKIGMFVVTSIGLIIQKAR